METSFIDWPLEGDIQFTHGTKIPNDRFTTMFEIPTLIFIEKVGGKSGENLVWYNFQRHTKVLFRENCSISMVVQKASPNLKVAQIYNFLNFLMQNEQKQRQNFFGKVAQLQYFCIL